MISQIKLSTKLLVAVAFALISSHIYLLSELYVSHYSSNDGFKLVNNHPIGGDFVTFFQAGGMIKTDPKNLYNFEYYLEKQQQFFKSHSMEMGKLVFAYPPLVGYGFSLLPQTTLLNAFIIWTLISLTLFFGALIWLMKSVNAPKLTIAIAIFAAFGFCQKGQKSDMLCR